MSGGRAVIGETINVTRTPGASQVPPTIVIHSGTEDEEASADSSVSSVLTYSESQSAEDEAKHEDANDNIASTTPPSASVAVVERPGLELEGPTRTHVGSQVQSTIVTGQTHQQNEVCAPEQAPEQSEITVERPIHENGISPGDPPSLTWNTTIHFLCTFMVFVAINTMALFFFKIIVKYYASAH